MSSSTLISVADGALRAFKDFTNDGDVQIQTVRLFFQVVIQEGQSIDYAALGKILGVTQPAVSRNLKKLSIGAGEHTKYDLVHVEVDYSDARRRIVKLSPRGRELVQLIESNMLPGLLRYVTKEGVRA